MTFGDDETPTKPDAAGDPTALVLARIHGELDPTGRHHLARLVEAWYALPLNQRVLVESVASEFARPTKD